jgi:galactokinase
MSTDRHAEQAVSALSSRLGRSPDGVWFAPGRVNLVGEHTDYNDGFVAPLALDVGTAAALAVRDDDLLRLVSGSEPDVVEIAVSEVGPGSPPGWAGYAAGTAWAMHRAGHPVPGLDIAVAGDVPLGAGLSSSASLECAVAVAIDDLTGARLGGDEAGRTVLAGLARQAENDVVGVPCGIMDQMAAMHGRQGHLVFVDTRSLHMELVPFDPAAADLVLLVIDTRAPHRLVEGAYADRRRSCEQAAAYLGVPALRDVTDLSAALAGLPTDVLRRRVRHVVTENHRVLEVVTLLSSPTDPRRIGPLLTASHESLRDDYEVSIEELDVAVDAALAVGAHGARMTGGGFGGSVIALADTDRADAVVRSVAEAFSARGFTAPRSVVARPSDGARRLA